MDNADERLTSQGWEPSKEAVDPLRLRYFKNIRGQYFCLLQDKNHYDFSGEDKVSVHIEAQSDNRCAQEIKAQYR